ncbi:MAG: hypothetical protein BMS9Abin32_528 [Gammaproteobacteria bacterium]|nr:MAG: hypothetical protein BMS9Abin32_528 [Gammaproteobacteria bacterium]
MKNAVALALFWLGLSAVLNLADAQEPLVRISITPETISVGEPAQLTVTVLVPTWFPRPPRFPSFEIANAIVRLPPDSSRPTSQRVGRDTWSGIVRRYQVIPLTGATYRLKDLSMPVTYADPDTRRPVTKNVALPGVEFRAQVPVGAEGVDPYIAGSSLTLRRDIEGDLESLQVGDALVLLYSAELDGLPAIFLPPLVGEIDIPHAAVYAAEPVLEESGRARRSEKITLVFESAGDLTIPGIGLQWWNTDTKTVETALVPAISIAVAGPASAPADEKLLPYRWQAIAFSLLALLLVVAAASRGIPAVLRRYRAFQEERRLTERYAFDQLRKTLRSGDAAGVYKALLCWLERLEPRLDARQFAVHHGDVELRTQIERLSRTLFLSSDEPVDIRRLETGLVSARKNYRHACAERRNFALPQMNP